MTILRLILVLCLVGAQPSFASPSPSPRFKDLGLPSSLSKRRLQGLLQRFVDAQYRKSFRHLGDERDFDHGHILFARGAQRPVAILYHTQELAHEYGQDSPYGYLDPRSRNWLQWIDRDSIENAALYARKDYPRSPSWDWFRERDLPGLEARHTIVDKMLDPALLGAQISKSVQMVFARIDCAGVSAASGPDSSVMTVVLPSREKVCVVLSCS